MRLTLTLLGFTAIVAYSIVGALLVNDWAVVAASEQPLDTTIARMDAAGQPYSAAGGIVFAAIGVSLATGWVVLSRRARASMTTWGIVAIWAAIIAFGAPAFFFASFGNLNSVGDTYLDWNSEATLALEAPLFLASLSAAAVALAALVIGVVRVAFGARRGGAVAG